MKRVALERAFLSLALGDVSKIWPHVTYNHQIFGGTILFVAWRHICCFLLRRRRVR